VHKEKNIKIKNIEEYKKFHSLVLNTPGKKSWSKA
jgi:hypothetical protein